MDDSYLLFRQAGRSDDVMRVSQEEKDRSHCRIVESAARLVRERGVERTSVAEIMTNAGLTHGGFYRHFDTKEALVAAALEAAFDQMISAIGVPLDAGEPDGALARTQAYYLSEEHAEAPGSGCPVAALGPEVARGPDMLKQAFGAGVERMIATLARAMRGSVRAKRTRAARQFAMMVGAMVIARASDPETRHTVLEACRSQL